MRGQGPYAEGIEQTFKIFSRKLGLDQPWPELDTSHFQPPSLPGRQLTLF